MYKYILLDADNTIFNFDKAQYESLNVLLRKHGITCTTEIYDEYMRINHSLWQKFEHEVVTIDYVQTERFSKLFEILGQPINGVVANKIYQDSLKECCYLMPHAEEVCRILSSFSTLAIVTNGVGETQKNRIAKSKIAKYISLVMVSEDIGFQKPNIEFFKKVFLRLEIANLKEILIVGDSLFSDIQGGINAGINTCYYNSESNEKAITPKPHYIINDLRELIEIVL